MRIIDILQSCIFPIDGLILHSGAKWLQNIKADDITFPCVFMDRPIQWRPTKVGKYAARQEVYSPVLYFAEKTRPEWEQWQHDEVIERQRINVAQFLETLTIHPEVDLITTEPTCTDLINFLDLNTSGVSVSLSVRLKIADGTCPNVPYLPSRPIITSISPDTIYTQSTNTITLTGSGFMGDFEISVNGNDIEWGDYTFISSQSVSFAIGTGSNTLTGTRDITITNPDGSAFTFKNCLSILAD